MIQDIMETLDPKVREEVIASLRYWIMFDMQMRKCSVFSQETNVMLKNLSQSYPKEIVDRFFQKAWNNISAEFLRCFDISPNLLY